MLVIVDGRERSEQEYADLLTAAGFVLDRTILTHGPFSLIETVRRTSH